MTAPAIRVHNLSKQYHIGARENANATFREAVAGVFTNPFRRLQQLSGRHDEEETFWALKDVSFDVHPGEVVGIIGRNGAGKSTLLKILSRITEPTTGRVEINGRVASLLEVGTGFHPELTGRENIYLNGSILGMSRAEIKRRFDEIVDFAEVERFLDTPVKRYSSGMSVRLGFAVAAHLEPEILIVDEVLAVGDAGFQEKCVGKMTRVASEGRTVIFVSHTMPAVAKLCSRGIVFAQGGMIADGTDVNGIISSYLESFAVPEGALLTSVERPKNHTCVIRDLQFLDASGAQVTTLPIGQSITFRIHYHTDKPIYNAGFGLVIENSNSLRILWIHTQCHYGRIPVLQGDDCIDCHVPSLRLLAGVYHVSVGCNEGPETIDNLYRARKLTILERDIFGMGRVPQASQCITYTECTWAHPSVV